ncbi:MAG: YlbF family regulator [Chloroflexi bacterium]|nr:YlbF family regulator [Chloroflexota bacterium]
MSAKSMTLPPTIRAAAERLAAAIETAEPIVAYRHAKARLDGDPHADELLQQLSAAQADLRKRQSNGGVTPAALEQVRAMQREVQANPVIMQFAMAQQEAVAYLPQVNQEISELLGMDFASLAGPGSC